jgi:hypothetical protein
MPESNGNDSAPRGEVLAALKAAVRRANTFLMAVAGEADRGADDNCQSCSRVLAFARAARDELRAARRLLKQLRR